MKRKLTSLLLAALMLTTTFAGVAYAEEPEAFDDFARPRVVSDAPLKVGWMNTNLSADSQQRKQQQAEIEGAHRGWDLTVASYETDDDFRNTFQSLLNMGVDAIIIDSAENMEAKMDLIAQAREQGVGIYNNDNAVVDGVISNVSCNNAVGSLLVAYQIGIDTNWNANIATIQAGTVQVHSERIQPAKGLFDGTCYSAFQLIDQADNTSSNKPPQDAAYEFVQTWLQKYGTDLDVIFLPWDGFAIAAAEAIEAAGYSPDDFIAAGFDGGNQAWMYIRNNTAFKYTFSQPLELYTHTTFEIVDAIQVKGINPGEDGCPIDYAGQCIFADGFVTTRENVPQVGQSVHAVFDYYGGDPDDADAWYNWDDGPGIYMVQDVAE